MQFNSVFAVSFHSTRSDFRVKFDCGVISCTNHNSLLCIATNEIAAFCIYGRLHQMAFFRVRQSGQRPALDLWRKKNEKSCSSLFLYYYIKQMYSMFPCVCSVIDHRRRQNVVRTSVTQSAIASCATFLFLPHFDIIYDVLLN